MFRLIQKPCRLLKVSAFPKSLLSDLLRSLQGQTLVFKALDGERGRVLAVPSPAVWEWGLGDGAALGVWARAGSSGAACRDRLCAKSLLLSNRPRWHHRELVVLLGFCSAGCRLELTSLGGRVHPGLSPPHRRGLGLGSVLLGEESWCVRQCRCRETQLFNTESCPGH